MGLKSKKLDKMLIGDFAYASENSITWSYRNLFLKGIYLLAPQVFGTLYYDIFPLDPTEIMVVSGDGEFQGPLKDWAKSHNLDVEWFYPIAFKQLLDWEPSTVSGSDDSTSADSQQNDKKYLSLVEVFWKEEDFPEVQSYLNLSLLLRESLQAAKNRMTEDFRERLGNFLKRIESQASNKNWQQPPEKIKALIDNIAIPRELVFFIEYQVNKKERPEIRDEYRENLLHGELIDNPLETIRKDIRRAGRILGIKPRKGKPGKRAKKK